MVLSEPSTRMCAFMVKPGVGRDTDFEDWSTLVSMFYCQLNGYLLSWPTVLMWRPFGGPAFQVASTSLFSKATLLVAKCLL